uniref:KiSS-1 metastasis suppressor n=1 Tax=Nomascus leucogenys TaxID=61853 RepID=A0A2I3HFY1_NOMLE
MNSLVSWQLLLFLCATHFGEEGVAKPSFPDPGLIFLCHPVLGQQLESLGLLAPWEQSLPCTERKPAATARLSRRGTSLSPPPESSGSPQRPGLSAPHSRQIPAPQGAVLVQRERDLPNYNWNSFGLRFGKREAAPGNHGRSAGRGAEQ